MSRTLTLARRHRAHRVNLRLFRRLLRELLGSELSLEHFELGICLLDEPRMTRLNESFLNHAGSTDVITFDYGTVAATASLPARLHGEIYICLDEAVLQARRYGTSWQSELVRYAVHGVLHLLGYDDLRIGPRRRMKREENRLLRRLARQFDLTRL